MLNAHLSTDFQNLQITRRLTCDTITLRDKSQFIFPFLTDWNDATQCVVFEKRNFQNLSFKDSWIKNCGHWKKMNGEVLLVFIKWRQIVTISKQYFFLDVQQQQKKKTTEGKTEAYEFSFNSELVLWLV